MGGVLQYKWELSLRSQEGPAIQMGGVLPYKSKVFETSGGWVSETLLNAVVMSSMEEGFGSDSSVSLKDSNLKSCDDNRQCLDPKARVFRCYADGCHANWFFSRPAGLTWA